MLGLLPENYLGSYRGTPIRLRQPGELVGVTDLWKANGAPSRLRPDRWIELSETQQLLQTIASQINASPEIDKKGYIAGIPGVLEVFRGGDRLLQGTFGSRDVVTAYSKSLSNDCFMWLTERVNSVSEQSGQVIKAKPADISLGDRKLDVYQLPSGNYLLSQTQTAESVDADEFNVRYFLRSNSPEALPYKGFTPDKLAVDGSRTRINGIPIPLAVAFWTKEAISGNSIASRLLGACAIESIERRADKAFGVVRSDQEYNKRFKEAFQHLVSGRPEALALANDEHHVQVSAPLHDFYSVVGRKLKKLYPNGGIPGMTKEGIVKELAFLASHTNLNYWKLTPQQELNYNLGPFLIRSKYPDLMTGLIPINVDGQYQKAIFVFQVYGLTVDDKDVEDCALSKQYVRLARECTGADHAFLFFVSPFGATPRAFSFIQERLPGGNDGCKGCVGVLTVKELAQFYHRQIVDTKQQAAVKARITKKFDTLLNYKIPDNPLALLMDDYQQLTLFGDT